jgi:TrmH family RNA methyltransferase
MEIKYITSRKNPLVSEIFSLRLKKNRDAERLFTAGGIKLFAEAAACRAGFFALLVRKSESEKILPIIGETGSEKGTFVLDDGVFDKISEEKSPEGLISVIKYLDTVRKSDTIEKDALASEVKNEGVIALESVRDPGNVGTIIRSAAAFGFETLLMSDDCADVYSPRAVRAAMGALFSRRVILTGDLPGALCALRESGRRIYAAALAPGSTPLQDTARDEGDIFVIGNEGHGLSAAVLAQATAAVRIPMLEGPGVESLNAAVAASVIMYERKRC